MGFVDMAEHDVLARAGSLEVRLAATLEEVIAAQALRYRVFFEEGSAAPDEASRRARRDLCRFDEVCDHVLVFDTAAPRAGDGAPAIVGAYRVLRQEVAERGFGFYSAGEFEAAALIARHPSQRFLELGRSCVAADYRGKRTIETLWRGVWAYALQHRIDVMFGCASFAGTDVAAHSAALAALRQNCAAEPEWSVEPTPAAVRAPPPPAVSSDPRAALRDLPPLVKGYLRLGARFSQEAVIDEAFGAIDVFVVLRVADIQSRYLAHFAPAAQPIAA
jgi:putative hemolysin